VNSGERRAARHYRLRGYRLLAANVRCGRYELDLVLRRGRRLVICEVKEKTGDTHGTPAEMVDAEKLRRVERAAAAWLAAHPQHAGLDVRIEVAAVRRGRVTRLVRMA
jgi:putative endonuclease